MRSPLPATTLDVCVRENKTKKALLLERKTQRERKREEKEKPRLSALLPLSSLSSLRQRERERRFLLPVLF